MQRNGSRTPKRLRVPAVMSFRRSRHPRNDFYHSPEWWKSQGRTQLQCEYIVWGTVTPGRECDIQCVTVPVRGGSLHVCPLFGACSVWGAKGPLKGARVRFGVESPRRVCLSCRSKRFWNGRPRPRRAPSEWGLAASPGRDRQHRAGAQRPRPRGHRNWLTHLLQARGTAHARLLS